MQMMLVRAVSKSATFKDIPFGVCRIHSLSGKLQPHTSTAGNEGPSKRQQLEFSEGKYLTRFVDPKMSFLYMGDVHVSRLILGDPYPQMELSCGSRTSYATQTLKYLDDTGQIRRNFSTMEFEPKTRMSCSLFLHWAEPSTDAQQHSIVMMIRSPLHGHRLESDGP